MSMKGYGSITLTDVLDGAQIWTTTTAPTSPNYTFNISNLSGDSAATVREGDLIFYSYYRYTVASVGTTTVLATNQQNLRGANGAAGLNNATVTLYQRSSSAPGKPNFNSTYKFSTKTLSGIPSGNAWSQQVPATGTNPIWITFATASSTTDEDTIPASEWANVIKLTGEDGSAGYNQATIFLYQRSATEPSKPTATPTYTFATGALSAIPTGWSRTIPENNGDPCWATTTTAISQSSTATVGAWSDVVKLAEDGFTPTVTATRSGNTTTISITNATGTSTTDINDGERGATWYAGTAITGTSGAEKAFPSSGVANAIIGDHYLNTSTQNVYVCTTPGTPSVAKWSYEQNIKGEKGTSGDKGYIHIKYSNDGGTTFTGNGGEDPGDWMGVYSDNTQADSTSVSAYQWVKVRGLSVEKVEKEYCLISSSSAVPSGTTWTTTIPDYESGKWYWSREVTTWSDGSTTNGEAILEVAMTEALHRAALGLGMKINYSAFSTTTAGDMYLHGYTNGEPADVNGFVYWKDVKRTVNKGLINPNSIVPYNRYIYIVLRLTNATSTTGAKYMVWYNSGWKYAITPTPSTVGGTWTWDEARDVVLGQFIEPGSESDVVEAYLYNPPRSASQVITTTASPYQYSQGAVEWHSANGGNVINAMTMLSSWADGAFSATTEINGGYIKTHTIESEHLATDAIMSSNFQAASDIASPFSATGTFLDLTTGSLYSPNFGIDNSHGTAYLNGEIIATSGRIGNSSASNYWEIGTKTDYNADTSAALIGKGTAYIQVGEFQLSNGLLDTRHYDTQNKIIYPVYDNTYWDFGVQAPVLDTSTSGYVSGVDDNFLYIRKHASTIPSLKSEWEYLFRVDKNGNMYFNGGIDSIKVKDSEDRMVGLSSIVATKDSVGADYLPITGGTITGNLTVNGTITGTASKATQLANSRTFITSLESTTAGSFDGKANVTVGISGTLGVAHGGTGATAFTSGQVLIGNGQNAITTRAITNNTSANYISGSTNLITANTLKFWNGAYDTNHSSNIEYVKQGLLGDVVTHDFDEFITTDGGIIDGSLQVTDLTAGSLIVTGAARFTNGLFGDLTGNADTADKVNNNLIIKLASGTTEGTNMFTFNGSAAKTVDITKSAIGLGNVENTKLSTWTGSSALTTAKVGTLAGAAVKAVDTSISAGSTSVNLPTSAAVASFVEGKGYVTSSGVTSVRVQATSPVVSSVNTEQSSTLNTTISLADGYGDTKNPYASKTKNYVLAAPSTANGAPTFRALVADDIPTLASSKVGLGNVTNNKQVKGLASGTTSGHLVSWGTDGYTVADAGIAKGSVTTKLTLSGTDYSASSNVITITKANLQSAVQDTSYVLMTTAERSKLESIQVSEGGTIDFSGVTATAPLTATVATDKTVTISHNTSGVSAGTYRSVTVDTYGHVTAGTNPTTLSGYGITDAKIASGVITLGSNTITPLTASSSLNAAKLTGTASVSTTGNATTATKFSSARSITLTGDVTGSASSNGESGWSIATTVGDNSHNHVPSNIIARNDNTSGGLDPITASKIGSAASNKTFGLPANAITIEYSTDGGATWVDYGATDAQKRDLFNETRTTNFWFGKSAEKSVDNQLRVTIEPTDRYTSFHGLYCWMSTSGNTCTVDLERSTIGNKNTFSTVFTGKPLAGWSGNNIIYFTYGTFGGGSTQTGNQYKYRMTFKQTAITTANTTNSSIQDIRFIGDNVWSSPNVMVSKNHMYSWDRDLNVTFPAQITATQFNGNATTATSATSATSATTAGKWASAQTVYVTLGTASKTTTIQGGSSSAQTIGVDGTLAVAHGGTGKTTGKDAANYFLNSLDTGSSTPVDGDYYISQYVSGGTTTTTYHRRPMSALWSYINGKAESVYAKLSGATFTGAVTGTSFGASGYLSANTDGLGTTGGLALYSTSPTNYGIAMRLTSNCGKHGYVQGDWAIATYMSANANVVNRGWIFRSANTAAHNVASISGEGHAVFNGSVTVGGNETNTSGCRMEFNTNTQSMDFVFN